MHLVKNEEGLSPTRESQPTRSLSTKNKGESRKKEKIKREGKKET